MKRNPFAALREGLMRLMGLARFRRNESDLRDELANHVELAEEDLLRRGHSPEEARRLARIRVGNETQAMETLRQQNGMPALSAFWLDTKLGLRMLRKHWGLTLVGGLAMAVAIGAGATVFDVVYTLMGTQLPLEEGDRVVTIQPWDPATRKERYTSPEDFLRWRDALESVEHVAAFATVERNLITEDGRSAPVTVAEMSPAGFQVARVNPLLGRFLLEEDERSGADPVVVIGHNVWRSRFGADSGVIGRRLQLGRESYTVVGVMPEGFVFPITHDVWIPLHAASPPARQLLAEPPWGDSEGDDVLTVFARLAPGVGIASAQAEVAAKGLVAAEIPEAGRSLEARLVPYTVGITGHTDAWLLRILGWLLVLLLVPPCANIAVLIYARIIAREQEFAARLALGASRGRIISQIFTEVLVLSALAATLGLFLARQAVAMFQSSQEQRLGRALPFWMNFDLSLSTMLYAFGLAMAAALLAGAIPAIRATGRWNQSGLHALGNRTSPRLGKIWISVVVLQVALSVATLPAVLEAALWNARSNFTNSGFDPGEYLTARLVIDRDAAPAAGRTETERYARIRGELVRQLEADSGIHRVSVSQALPGGAPLVLVERAGGASSSGRVVEWVRVNRVDEAFFETYRMQLLAGRWFRPGDPSTGSPAPVLINRHFAERMLSGGTPLGAQLLSVTPGGDHAPAPEWEVVGVVDDSLDLRSDMTMYLPLPETPDLEALSLSIHAVPSGNAGSGMPRLAERLREIGAALDPSMRIIQPRTLGAIYEDRREEEFLNSSVMLGLVLGVVLFSVAGIYTILSFTVVQRRREIGIRSALGASPSRLVGGIFRSAMLPVVAGVLIGSLVAIGIEWYLFDLLFGSIKQDRQTWIFPAAEAFILAIGLLAIAGPARRALAVDPVESLRDG